MLVLGESAPKSYGQVERRPILYWDLVGDTALCYYPSSPVCSPLMLGLGAMGAQRNREKIVNSLRPMGDFSDSHKDRHLPAGAVHAP